MKNLLVALLSILTLAGCEKFAPQTPAFDVTTDKTTYKVGEEINFSFTGNPDNITFFSGEMGHRYQYDGRFTEKGVPILNFSTALANGNQENSLMLLVSKDFSGLGADSASTSDNISKATWVNITDKANLSDGATATSGDVDLSDFAKDGKPVFIAFKYTGVPGSKQNKWTITGLSVKNHLMDGTIYSIADLSTHILANYGVSSILSPGWAAYTLKGKYKWVLSSSSMVFTGAASDASATEPAEAWTFCGPVQLNTVSPDVGIPVKEMSTRLATYQYTFNQEGVYDLTFIASNSNIKGAKEIVKTIELTINP